jgi:hypothetical protein
MTSTALKLKRGEPISIKLTTNPLTWRRVGALVAFEIENRDWTYTETCARAFRVEAAGTRAEREIPLSYSTLRKLMDGDYLRGGPFFATLERVFCRAFASSGYEIVLSARGAELRKG